MFVGVLRGGGGGGGGGGLNFVTSASRVAIDSKDKQIAILMDELTVKNKGIDKIKKAVSLRGKENFEQDLKKTIAILNKKK